jgi:hypothetical protein
MKKLIKILHIDPSWKVMYFLIRGGVLIKSKVSLETALSLLSKQKFDLILSEPLNMAILTPQQPIEKEIMDSLKGLMKRFSGGSLESQIAGC